jgi:hypothetical protein
MRNLRSSHGWFRTCQERSVLGCVRLADTGGLAVPSPREVRGEGALASRIRSRGLTQFVRACPHFVWNFRACDAAAAAVLPSTTVVSKSLRARRYRTESAEASFTSGEKQEWSSEGP